MKRFDYEVALNQLEVGKQSTLNNEIRYNLIPSWVQGEDFLKRFLPYLKIVGDSREQDKWIEQACKGYGISFEWAKKDKQDKTENLKEGDYTFQVIFGNKTYSYIGEVAYERKGRVSEFFNNCTGYNKKNQTSDRERIKREFNRFAEKGYRKVVLMLEFGETLTDLIDMKFEFPNKGRIETKNTYYTMYSAVMSWKQPNNKNFDIIQSFSRKRLFWLFLQDCYYYFRNELRNECLEKNLIEEKEDD